MNDLAIKQYIVAMLEVGFILAPCKNPKCLQLFASDEFCTVCEKGN